MSSERSPSLALRVSLVAASPCHMTARHCHDHGGHFASDFANELTDALAKRQKENGSWVNSADRWLEGDPNLTTAYSLMALKYCDPK